MRDLEILLRLTYDQRMMVTAWLMIIFVVRYIATKNWNQRHREWIKSSRVWPIEDEMIDF